MAIAVAPERTVPLDSSNQVQTPQPFDPEGEQPFVDWLLDSSGIKLSAEEKAKYEGLRGKDLAELLDSAEGFEMLATLRGDKVDEVGGAKFLSLVSAPVHSLMLHCGNVSAGGMEYGSLPDGYTWIDTKELGFDLNAVLTTLLAAKDAGVLTEEQTADLDAAIAVFSNPESSGQDKAAAYGQFADLGQAVLPEGQATGLEEFSLEMDKLSQALEKAGWTSFFGNAFLTSDPSFLEALDSFALADSLGIPMPEALKSTISSIDRNAPIPEMILGAWVAYMEAEQTETGVDNSQMIATVKSIQSQMADGVKVQDLSFEAMNNSSSPEEGVSELYGKVSTMTATEFEAMADDFKHAKQERFEYLNFIAELKGDDLSVEDKTALMENDPQVNYYHHVAAKYDELGALARANGGDYGTLSANHYDANGKFSNQVASATMQLGSLMKVFSEAQVEFLMDVTRSIDVPESSRADMRTDAETARDNASSFLDAVQRYLSQVL